MLSLLTPNPFQRNRRKKFLTDVIHLHDIIVRLITNNQFHSVRRRILYKYYFTMASALINRIILYFVTSECNFSTGLCKSNGVFKQNSTDRLNQTRSTLWFNCRIIEGNFDRYCMVFVTISIQTRNRNNRINTTSGILNAIHNESTRCIRLSAL